MRDYYADLQVAPHADDGVITAAYRYLARAHHPDIAGAAGMRRMQSLNAAYEILSDPSRRREYDRERLMAVTSAWPQIDGAAAIRARRPRYLGPLAYSMVTAVCLMVVTVFWISAQPSLEYTVFSGRASRAITTPVTTSPRPRPTSAPRLADGLRRLPTATTGPDAHQKTANEIDQAAPAQVGSEPAGSAGVVHVEDWVLPPLSTANVDVPPETVPRPEIDVIAVAAPRPTPAPAYVRHVVQPGENLLRLTERYGVTQSAIVQINGLKDPDHLSVGDVLLIPTP
jgi:LysM repeat protein